jgi:hypothetical protein
MLYAVHLFPKVHTVNLNRSMLSCKPDIQNITDFRGTIASQDNNARVLIATMADNVFGDIFHAGYLPISRASSNSRWIIKEGLQT